MRQCSSQLCQVFSIELLSKRGRRLVKSVMAQKKTLLYPPGSGKLKDVISNYTSLTGSDKWLFQTMMPLVWRVVLQDCRAMVRLLANNATSQTTPREEGVVTGMGGRGRLPCSSTSTRRF